MDRHRFVLGAALAACAFATPLAAQTQDWQYRWFWGAKGGGLAYSLPTNGQVVRGQFGGEWVITARRTALYVGYSQSLTSEVDTFRLQGVTGGPFTISFDGMRRIQIGVIVFPTNASLQPYVGGGFVIETLTGALLAAGTTSTTIDNAIQNASSGGFALVIAGLQLRMGRKMALYAHYQGSPQGRDFLLAGQSHSFEAGLRYAFLGAREDDVTSRR